MTLKLLEKEILSMRFEIIILINWFLALRPGDIKDSLIITRCIIYVMVYCLITNKGAKLGDHVVYNTFKSGIRQNNAIKNAERPLRLWK